MTDVALRAVREDEAGVVLDLWVRAGENAARPADEPDAVVRLVAHDPEALVVAEVDGLVVGTVIAGWDGWRADRYRLAVDPDVRGRGIGGLLLARAEQHLRTLGAARFCAMVLEDDDLGRESWTSRGYVPQDDWRRWVEAASS